MEILEAFDLTGSFRAAGRVGRLFPSHRRALRRLAYGRSPAGEPQLRAKLIDPHLAKVEEWVVRSNGRIRADVVADKLEAVGFAGVRAHGAAGGRCGEGDYRAGRRRVYRPWIPEPGMWAQWDWGQGPRVGDRVTNLFCAWLAWSRLRVVIPTWDRRCRR